ncbi:MAG: hypothetical protein A3K19_12165 [Lentisphaerae bacterium RIFOXYB12_FULL_65_16]|nr:MAG: hypothetical protein A3K18_14560 [Lentisphaerae bacterium RIFOXYA12_64_32]OGV86231.1 MAG: hypothetical protein A3K19_12165 [Lentisphaerae bacterium RIFOXYB12_FULL_65_16]
MDRQCSCYSTRTRKFEIDWKAHPAAVFESDDWGACEYVIGPEDDRRRLAIMGSFFGQDHHPTLETPEFLAGLHHTGPKPWLKLLREDSEKGEIARKLFDIKCYSQDWHLPEYDGMDVREQFAWVAAGVERFKRVFGFAPKAAINSDAYPETETVWALNGIETICLKVCRVEGKIVTYGEKKPWNMQHPDVPIGAYNTINDVVYLGRNVFFDGARRTTAGTATPLRAGP